MNDYTYYVTSGLVVKIFPTLIDNFSKMIPLLWIEISHLYLPKWLFSVQLPEGTSQDNNAETEYLQAIGEAGQNTYSQSYKERRGSGGQGTSGGEGEDNSAEGDEEVQFTTKWENASGWWFKLL